jgi:hypothetical protein
MRTERNWRDWVVLHANRGLSYSVMPAKAGIQVLLLDYHQMDAGMMTWDYRHSIPWSWTEWFAACPNPLNPFEKKP